jgi:hypothetical protein
MSHAAPPPGPPFEPPDLGFLQGDPEPVDPRQPGAGASAADRLPQAEADRLTALDGVDGAWIERDANDKPVVVLHANRPGPMPHLPSSVLGMPTRIVGGAPIRALHPGSS